MFSLVRTSIAAVIALLLLSVAHAETYVYDEVGRLIQVTYDDGSEIYYTYDLRGNIVQRSNVAPAEVDTDGDGILDINDPDDDNDGIPDIFEIANGLDSLNPADASADPDGDGATNLQEFQTGTDPQNAASIDACLSSVAIAPLASSSALGLEQRLYFANPGSNVIQQTFLRFVNPNATPASVEVYGIDDDGVSSNKVISFMLPAQASLQFNAQDIENGNANKITGNLCNGKGKWQLKIRSDKALKVMSLIRTPDGFLTSVNDVVPKSGSSNQVFFANPASNIIQQTFMRFVNMGAGTGTVTITGVDDAGVASPGTMTFTLGPNESKQINAQEIEGGNLNKGLTGSLGNGAGKWFLTVISVLDMQVMSLIRTPDGFLTNLSGMVTINGAGDHVIQFGNPASEPARQTFLRIINTTNQMRTVAIAGIDDNGNPAPGGNILFDLGPNASKQMNAGDLENGNAGKGLAGALGDGTGRWRLTVSSLGGLQVMSLVRTPDGFLTNLSRVTPIAGNVNDAWFFNPGTNPNQVSSLRVINDSNTAGTVTITGIDDNGNAAPGGSVTFTIAAKSGKAITAADLENGNAGIGLTGALGNGAGKWRLKITSTLDLKVQGLMNTPSGFLTNLSSTAE